MQALSVDIKCLCVNEFSLSSSFFFGMIKARIYGLESHTVKAD